MPSSLPLVYIAGPFRGPTPYSVFTNVCAAEAAGLAIATLGAYPIIPHTMTQHFDQQLTDQFWLEGTMELMRRCDAVFLIFGWERSRGATAEMEEAKALDIPIFTTHAEVSSWIRKLNSPVHSPT